MKILQSIRQWWDRTTAVKAESAGCPFCSHGSFFVIDAASGLRRCARCSKPSYPPSGESLSILERGPNEQEPQERFVRRMTIRRPPATEIK